MIFKIIFILLTLLIIQSSLLVIKSTNPIYSIFNLILVFIGVTLILLILGIDFIAMLFLIIYIGAISVLFLFIVMMLNLKIVNVEKYYIYYIILVFNIVMIFVLIMLSILIPIPFLHIFVNSFDWIKYGLYSHINLEILPYSFGINNKINNNYLQDYEYIGYGVSNSKDDKFSLIFYDIPPLPTQLSFAEWYFYYFDIISITNIKSISFLLYTEYIYFFIISGLILLIAMIGAIVLTSKKTTNKEKIKNFSNISQTDKTIVIKLLD